MVLVPGVLALLPEYAGLTDPVAELRAACLAAVRWLTGPVAVVADAQGRRVAEHLLARRPARGRAGDASYLVVANGSAAAGRRRRGTSTSGRSASTRRSTRRCGPRTGPRWPGSTRRSARSCGPATSPGCAALGGLLAGAGAPVVDYADDPFGVQYWVMRWTCAS